MDWGNYTILINPLPDGNGNVVEFSQSLPVRKFPTYKNT